MNLGTMQSASIKVPGAAATSVHGLRIWDLLLDVLCQTSTLLRFGFLSAKRTSARKRADFGQVWPMPLPYPEVHLRPTRDDEVEVANKKGLNFCVLVLNRLATSCMKRVDHTPPFGTPLSKQQWSAVKRLRPLVVEWNNFPEVTSSDMGRAASKMESVEDVLHGLEIEVAEISRDLRSYKAKNSSGPQRRLDFAEAVGTVVGSEMLLMWRKQWSPTGFVSGRPQASTLVAFWTARMLRPMPILWSLLRSLLKLTSFHLG